MDSIREAAPSAGNDGSAESNRFDALERTLEQFQENARHISVIVGELSSSNQDTLNQKLYTLTSGLQEIDRLKNDFKDVRVPLELLDYLDQGKNPQLYTSECLERTRQKNKEENGKIETYKKFNAHLLREFSHEMPTDTVSYLNIRNPGANGSAGGLPSVNKDSALESLESMLTYLVHDPLAMKQHSLVRCSESVDTCGRRTQVAWMPFASAPTSESSAATGRRCH